MQTEPTTGGDDASGADDIAALKLENALLKAHVDLSSPHGQMLAQAWAGREIDEAATAAIATQWDQVKPAPVVEPPKADSTETATGDTTPPQGDERIEGESAQARERQFLASSGSSTVVTPEVNAREASVAEAHKVMKEGGSRMDAIATGFHGMAVAAGKGDTSVLVVDPIVPNEE